MSASILLSEFATRFCRFIPSLVAQTHGDCELAEHANAFPALALELFGLQYHHNAAFRRFCDRRAVNPATVANWAGIPAIPTTAFKEFEITCLNRDNRPTVFYSSGTTEQKRSRHFHNRESLEIYESSLWPWFARHLAPEQSCDRGRRALVCLTPSAADAPHSSLAYMFEVVRRRWPGDAQVFMATVTSDGDWNLDLERVLGALENSVNERRPLLILGPAFSFVRLLEYLANCGLALALPSGSSIMETGGYKGRSREMSKPELHLFMSERLGIPANRIVSEYGMSELSSQAYDSQLVGRNEAGVTGLRVFRFPPWARAQVISPETGQEVRDGETGLLRVYDLANVFSVLSVQTQDLAIRRGSGFELLGRAAQSEPRGCSFMMP